jgi:hypothetical protein
MRRRGNLFYLAAFAIGLALVVLAGCGKGGNTLHISRLGFSMRLPEGWKQEGESFYADPQYEYPSGSVVDFVMEEETLAEFVDNLLTETEKMEKMQAGLLRVLGQIAGEESSPELQEAEKAVQSRVLTKLPRTISKHEAIEVMVEAPVCTLEVFIRRGDTVIWVNFIAPKEEFPQYEQLFRDAIDTIKVR